MLHRTSTLVALGVTLLAACDGSPLTDPSDLSAPALAPAVQAAGLPTAATVTVGRNGLGTDFFPPGSHDGSFHAKDAIRPRTTVIAAGGTVTFWIAAFHTLAIYQPGIGPGDIDLSSLEDPGLPDFPPIIDSSTGRIARVPLNLGATLAFDQAFTEPGRYLVMCEVLPHFVFAKMYAWIVVK